MTPPGPEEALGGGGIRAALVDMGGVLLDLKNDLGIPDGRADWRGRQALVHRLREAGAKVEIEDLERWLFGPWKRAHAERYRTQREASWTPHCDRLREETGVRLSDLEILETWFRPYGEALVPDPNGAEVLWALRDRGLRLALVSNVPAPGVLYRRVLGRHDLLAPFAATFFSYDEGSRKPAPQLLATALDRLETNPRAAVMIGDRRSADVAAGRAAGTWTIWLRRGDEEGPAPDATIESLAELPGLIGIRPPPPERVHLTCRPVVLGVAGGTGSGKTTVAQAILDAVGSDRIAFLAQDSYYRDVAWRNDREIAGHNFDHPSALDTRLLVSHLEALREGRAVNEPIYDFVRHRRTGDVRRIEPRAVVLVEGILLLAEPSIRALLDFKIFVDTDADVRLVRRLRRDMEERGRSPDSVLEQYMATVRPMHLEFVEPSKRWADVIVPEGGENRVALEMVAARVEQLLTAAEEG